MITNDAQCLNKFFFFQMYSTRLYVTLVCEKYVTILGNKYLTVSSNALYILKNNDNVGV